MLPDFIIIGATRSGTTSLYENLSQHPCIVPAFNKEPSFFNLNFARGLKWYRSQFPLELHKFYFEKILQHEFMTGEASANYFYYPSVPERISTTLSKVKLILLLRDPVHRAYSDYQLSVRSHKEVRSFQEAVRSELSDSVKLTAENERSILRLRYLLKGIYVDHLERWLKFFSREKLLILKSEDLFSEQPRTFSIVLDHLGLPSWQPKQFSAFREPGKKIDNDAIIQKQYERMDAKTDKLLKDFFRPYNQRLYDLLGQDLLWND